MNRQLIIAGFHRSGTSMLAQELHNAGLFVGENLMPPSLANIDGYYEDLDIVAIHDRILECNDTDWQHCENTDFKVPLTYEQQINNIADKYTRKHCQWGFKDPRSTFFLNKWYKTLKNPYTIIVYRHYNETTESLLHRESRHLLSHVNPSALRFWKESELANKMWLAYNQKLVQHALDNPDTTIIVSHKALLEGLPIISILDDKFDIKLNADEKTIIEPLRPRSEVLSPLPIENELYQELETTWNQLEKLSLSSVTHATNSKVFTKHGYDVKNIQQNLTLLIGPIYGVDKVKTIFQNLVEEKAKIDDKIKLIQENISILLYLGHKIKVIKALDVLLGEIVFNDEILMKTLGNLYIRVDEFEKAEYLYLSI